jgi:hypothetical protein
MSRELDLLAKEYAKEPVSVLRKDISLYQRNLTTELSGFIKEVERTAKKEKKGGVIVVAVVKD